MFCLHDNIPWPADQALRHDQDAVWRLVLILFFQDQGVSCVFVNFAVLQHQWMYVAFLATLKWHGLHPWM